MGEVFAWIFPPPPHLIRTMETKLILQKCESKAKRITMVNLDMDEIKVIVTLNKGLNTSKVRTYHITNTDPRGITEPWVMTYMDGLRVLVELKNWNYIKVAQKSGNRWKKYNEKKARIVFSFTELYNRLSYPGNEMNEHWKGHYNIPDQTWEDMKGMKSLEKLLTYFNPTIIKHCKN